MPAHNRSLRGAVALMLLVSLGFLQLLVSGLSTYVAFVNPYSYVPSGPVSSIEGMGMTPLANRTVVFVLDGVRADTFYQTSKPEIEAYDDWANFTAVHCSTLLSVSRTGYCVISSGVNSTESQVISNEHKGVFPADSIWNTTVMNSGTTAMIGSDSWYDLFGPWLNYSLAFTSQVPNEESVLINATSGVPVTEVTLPDYRDSLASQYARLVLERYSPTFMVVHFGETDEAGHQNGTASESYVTALKNEDTCIGEVLDAYDAMGLLNTTLVIVVSDHGQVDVLSGKGEHGGIEEEVLHIPLLIRGPGVKPGIYDDSVHQNSIAPTIAAVMGWAVPSDCSGTVLFQCLSFTVQQEAVYRINLSEIRLAQATHRVSKMSYLTLYQSQIAEAEQLITYARGNFTSGNSSAAIDGAITSIEVSESILRESWNAKVAEERTTRLLVVLACIFAGILVAAVLFRGSFGSAKTALADGQRVAATIVVIVMYFALLYVGLILFGWRFSASYFFTSVEDFLIRMFGPTLFALLPSLLVLFLLLRLSDQESGTPKDAMVWLALLIFIITGVYLSVTAYFIVDSGPGLLWHLSNADRSLMYFFFVLSFLVFTLATTLVLLVKRLLPARLSAEMKMK